MTVEANQQRILLLYLQMELNMATLYELFAGSFPDHRDLLLSLVSEEREHASWIRYLLDQALQEKIRFVEGKLRTSTLETLNRYLSETIARHRQTPYDIVHAAVIVLDLERSLIEKNVFRAFHDDSAEVSRILQVLVEEQERHVRKIEQFNASVQGEER